MQNDLMYYFSRTGLTVEDHTRHMKRSKAGACPLFGDMNVVN